jgi:UDP-N-acetylmuramoyl-L-alanyl-D-glutamate--2,6-diaminopimelate ligase
LAAGALTHISRDHMDYHRDAADYAAAKLGLFSRALPEGATAVANTDDPNFAAVADIAATRGLRLIGVGENAGADIRLLGIAYDDTGQTIRFSHGGAAYEARLALIGGFQAHNALVAAGLVIGAGAEPGAVFAALPRLVGVRGRMELVARRDNGAAVFVDYAHTPGSVEAALAALRLHTPGRLVVVFGAGGDRDPGKRPLMGEAAARGADHVIVTDDNPRSEDPAAIRAAVLAGAPEAEDVGDRAEAILRGVDTLGPHDRLLIAGKGHETGQEMAGTTHPFDDAEVARAAVAALDGEDEG